MRGVAALVLCLALPPLAFPAPLVARWFRHGVDTNGCPLYCPCPCDYCRKPYPPFYCLPCGGPNDYCKKPFPPIYCLPCGGPSDYCKKPFPGLICPRCGPEFTCGEPARH